MDKKISGRMKVDVPPTKSFARRYKCCGIRSPHLKASVVARVRDLQRLSCVCELLGIMLLRVMNVSVGDV